MSVLKDLFCGNLSPIEKQRPCGREMGKKLRRMNEADEKLCAILSDEQRDVFEKFKAHGEDRVCLAEREMFIEGFKLGAQMAVEIMSDENWKQ